MKRRRGSVRTTAGVAVALALAGVGAIFPAAGAGAEDTEPPAIGCVPPPPPPPPLPPAEPTSWYSTNVGVRCSASDESGLADPSHASITLNTSVLAGTETANASTSSVEVCDLAENCVTVGPFSGIKIDRKAPTITLVTPANNARYSVIGTLLRPVKVSYSCVDGGAGLASCTGAQPDGATLDTGLGALGQHPFGVTARDHANNTSDVVHFYRVGLL